MTDSASPSVRSARSGVVRPIHCSATDLEGAGMVCGGEFAGILLAVGVEGTVKRGIAEHGLYVLAGLGEGDALDELRGLLKSVSAQPLDNPVLACVVPRQSIFYRPAELIQHLFEIKSAINKIDVG